STQLRISLTANDLSTAGTLSFAVVNPSPGGGTSATVTASVLPGLPSVTSLSPSTVAKGTSSPTTITVNGSNFIPSSVVLIGSTSRTTTYISSTQLTFQLTVADQATATTLAVQVVNPIQGGGSAIAQLTVAAPAQTPTITSANPIQFSVGAVNSSLSVVG